MKNPGKGGHNHSHSKGKPSSKSIRFRGNKTHSAGLKKWSNLKDNIGDKSSDASSNIGDFLKSKKAKSRPKERTMSVLDMQGIKSQSLGMKLQQN